LRFFGGFWRPIVSTVQFIVWRWFAAWGMRSERRRARDSAQDEIRGAIELITRRRCGAPKQREIDWGTGFWNLADLKVSD